jgi:medium-chain acyl-[acyl-carrier-protein] hydrolase
MWPNWFPASIQVCPVQLPGRGTRISEPLITQLSSMVNLLTEVFRNSLDKPFAFFGHSMGAIISFELSRRLRTQYGVQPQCLFISGRPAPQIPDRESPTYNLSDSVFLDELKRINGTPREIFEHPELINLMLPVLRSDFEVCQTHTYVEEPPLDCPITVFGGIHENITCDDLKAWAKQTVNRSSLHLLPGDHFFVRSEGKTIVQIILNQLEPFTMKA